MRAIADPEHEWLNSVPLPLVVSDERGQIVSSNRLADEALGGSVRARNLSDLFVELVDQRQSLLRVDGGLPIPVRVKSHRTGGQRYTTWSPVAVNDERRLERLAQAYSRQVQMPLCYLSANLAELSKRVPQQARDREGAPGGVMSLLAEVRQGVLRLDNALQTLSACALHSHEMAPVAQCIDAAVVLFESGGNRRVQLELQPGFDQAPPQDRAFIDLLVDLLEIMVVGRGGAHVTLRVGWAGDGLTLGLLSQGDPLQEQLRTLTSRVEREGGIVLSQQPEAMAWSVRISLPVSPLPRRAPPIGSEGLLLVTRDSHLRDQLRVDLGRAVTSVTSGQEAIRHLTVNPMAWDSMIFDLPMAPLSAADLLEWTADCCPWMVGRTILVAEPTASLTVGELLSLRRCPILHKPVSLVALRQALDRLGPLPAIPEAAIG